MTTNAEAPTESKSETAATNYGSRDFSVVATIYDFGNHVLTGGQNIAARLSQMEDIQPGDRVLYCGAGTCEDGLAAARKGARVTCVELSPAMIHKGRLRFEQAGLTAEFVCGDIMKYTPDEPFDIVVANFFLNVFTRPVMEKVYRQIVSFVRPGGKFLVVDFSRPYGNPLLMAIHACMFHGTFLFHRIFGLVGLHLIYDYTRYHQELGLKLTGRKRFRLFWIGPWLFESTTSIKVENAGS